MPSAQRVRGKKVDRQRSLPKRAVVGRKVSGKPKRQSGPWFEVQGGMVQCV